LKTAFDVILPILVRSQNKTNIRPLLKQEGADLFGQPHEITWVIIGMLSAAVGYEIIQVCFAGIEGE